MSDARDAKFEEWCANQRRIDEEIMRHLQRRQTHAEALRLMRDTTQSRDQFDRAVAALEAMGVRDEC